MKQVAIGMFIVVGLPFMLVGLLIGWAFVMGTAGFNVVTTWLEGW